MTDPSTEERGQVGHGELRLKQLEFLMKIIHDETESVDRWARLLVVGNAGGIGMGLVIYKDLQSKFSEVSIQVAILLFVAGLFLSGIFLAYVNDGYSSARKKIKDLVFSQEDISILQKQVEQVDNQLWFSITFLASIFCIVGGAVAILSQAVKSLLSFG